MPQFAYAKVDLVQVIKSEHQMQLIQNGNVFKSFHIALGDVEIAKQNGVKLGGDITIHGQKNGFGKLEKITQNWDWTNGCIALTNSDIDDFLKWVAVGTPIEIIW